MSATAAHLGYDNRKMPSLVLLLLLVGAVFAWLMYMLGLSSRRRDDEGPNMGGAEQDKAPASSTPEAAKPGGGFSTPPENAQAPAPIKILFLGAAPTDQVRLALDQEVREIESKLRESEHGRGIKLIQEWALRATDLQAVLLRHRPQIVHFSGHGVGSGELLMEDEHGSACPVPVDALQALFAILGKGIGCVVLNACYSQSQADAIRAHVPCVIGMQKAIADRAAIAFSSSFYLALGHGQSVAESFELGRLQIKLAGNSGNDAPVLSCQPGIDASTVAFRQSARANAQSEGI